MKIGLALPQYDYSLPGERPLRWETVAEWARHAEAHGFDSLWVSDHLFLDLARFGAADSDPGGCLDAVAELAALARITTRARLGPLVLNAALRPPSVTAKALATLDVLSGGRLVIGLGAGWYEPEFRAAGVPFLPPGGRLRQLAEAIEIMRGMFGGGPFTYRGRHWSVHEARCLPLPLQRPAPPVWVGGKGDALLRLAARHADGWNAVWAWTPEAYREKLDVLRAACDQVGRDPATITLSLGLYTLVGESEADLRRRFDRLRALSPAGVLERTTLEEWRASRLVGTVERVREQLAAWAGLGVEEVIVGAGAVPFAVTDLDDVSLIAEACNLG
ncbi:MAG: LLM class flavin-dependent oxidoreductase [Acidimicrobiales bacterium]